MPLPIRVRAVVPPPGDGASARGGVSRSLSFGLKAFVSGALLVYQLARVGVSEVGGVLTRTSVPLLLTAFALYVASHLLNAYRWNVYSISFGFSAPLRRFVGLYYAGLLLNLFAPGTVLGDFSRGLGLAAGERRAAALASVASHRITGMVALLCLVGACVQVQRVELGLPTVVEHAAWALPLLAVVLLIWLPPALSGMKMAGRTVEIPAGWPAATALTLLMAVLYHGLQVASAYVLAVSLGGVSVTALVFVTLVPLVNMAGAMPFSVSGIGVRESAYEVLLGMVGVPRESAVALGLLGTVLVVATGLLGLPALLSSRSEGNRKGPD